MLLRLSPSAARKFVFAVASFFLIAGSVGTLEFWLYQDDLLMAVVPSSLSIAAVIVALGFIALLSQKVHLSRFFGAALIGVMATVIWFVAVAETTRLVALPLPIVVPLITSTALLFILPPTRPVTRGLWLLVILVDLAVFALLQASFSGLISLEQFNLTQANFPALSLVSILLLVGSVALLLVYSLYGEKLHTSRRAVLNIFVIAAIGFGVWYSLSLNDLKRTSDDARLKIQMIGQMIDSTLSDQRALATRIQQRLDKITQADDFTSVLRNDMESYLRDLPILRGALIYNEQLMLEQKFGAADDLVSSGLLKQQSVDAWLASATSEPVIVISGSSLLTATPTYLMAIPIRTPAQQLQRLVLLFDVKQVVNASFLRQFQQVLTYLELREDLLLPIASDVTEVISRQQLQLRYPHFLSEQANISGTTNVVFHSALNDYSELKTNAQLNQLLLWLTFAFLLIYIMAEDNAQQLSKKQNQLKFLADHDEITGLLRRDAFNARIQQQRDKRQTRWQVLWFINLDGFKPINDSFGHKFGDEVLAETAARLRTVEPDRAILAHFSADEFVIFWQDTEAQSCDVHAQQLLRVIRKPFNIDGISVHLTASIGCVQTQNSQLNIADLLQQGEIAMSEAKHLGGNLVRNFAPHMAVDYQQQLQLRNALQMALEQQLLEVYYQPIYDTRQSTIVGIESLVRWQHNGLFVSPAEFIPIAERTGQIIPLGEQVLERVLQDIHDHQPLQRLQVAVNISPQQLQRYDFASYLQARLKHHQVQADNLTLELTEEVFAGESQTNINALQSLLNMGCSVALDDFGTGFSSLSYLNRLPADVIKIDRAFTAGIVHDPELQAVVRGIVELCIYLKKKVVVEGVEDESQVDIFSQIGVDRLQGFYFARPMPLAELLKLLE